MADVKKKWKYYLGEYERIKKQDKSKGKNFQKIMGPAVKEINLIKGYIKEYYDYAEKLDENESDENKIKMRLMDMKKRSGYILESIDEIEKCIEKYEKYYKSRLFHSSLDRMKKSFSDDLKKCIKEKEMKYKDVEKMVKQTPGVILKKIIFRGNHWKDLLDV